MLPAPLVFEIAHDEQVLFQSFAMLTTDLVDKKAVPVEFSVKFLLHLLA